jgi:predicted NUDIX family phosphoesterase
MSEKILVVETEKLFVGERMRFQGYLPYGYLTIEVMVNALRHLEERDRDEIEEDPAYKQIIPYCIIINSTGVFVVRRTNQQGEARLHDKHSIGFGGHANKIEGFTNRDLFLGNLYRELTEETTLTMDDFDVKYGRLEPVCKGLLNWDMDPVGKVHLGILFHLEVPDSRTIEIREKDMMHGDFYPIYDALGFENYETWSDLALKNYLANKFDELSIRRAYEDRSD